MKKKRWFLLMAGLLLLVFSACKGELDSGGKQVPTEGGTASAEDTALRVLVDLGPANTYINSQRLREKILAELQSAIEENGGPTDILFETIYYDDRGGNSLENSSLRDADLTRVRTEMMAGGGPDVFIVVCDNSGNHIKDSPLFLYPEQIMSRRAFLPLDEYIEKARFLEWDQLTPAVMEAGANEEGQQVLPLTYSMPLTVFRKSDLEHAPSQTQTFYDVAASGNPASLLFTDREKKAEEGSIILDPDKMAGIFLELADYETEEPTFSEEDLIEVMEALGELEIQRKSGAFADLPAHYYANLGVGFNRYPEGFPEYDEAYAGIQEKENLTLVPLYTVEGGYGAVVTSFAAVNRNTKRADDAFFVLDYLLSLECQRSSFYLNMTPEQAIPTHEKAMQRKTDVAIGGSKVHGGNGMVWDSWHLTPDNFQELCGIRDKIAHVRFRTELDGMLVNLFEKSRMLAGNRDALAREVHSAYMEMKMALAES